MASALWGPTLAPLVGTYAFVCVAWFAGVLVGLYRRDPLSRLRPRWFVAISAITTFGLTVPIADMLGSQTATPSSVALFAVAALIPAVGESWVTVVSDFYEIRVKPAFSAIFSGRTPP